MTTSFIVLAAGKGSRMNSDLPKVLHPLHGKPLLHHILDTLQSLNTNTDHRYHLVVGYQANAVQRATQDYSIQYSIQHEQLGTGHAVQQALTTTVTPDEHTVVILPGDCPLISSRTLLNLLNTHHTASADATVLTTQLTDPGAYGRIIRNASGDLIGIQEAKDCSPDQLAITEINAGIYVFNRAALVDSIQTLTCANAQGEYYLTDVIGNLYTHHRTISSVCTDDPTEAMGVNTADELSELAAKCIPNQ